MAISISTGTYLRRLTGAAALHRRVTAVIEAARS